MKNKNFFLGLSLSLIMLSPIFVQAAGGEGGTNEQTGFTVKCESFSRTLGPIPQSYCNNIKKNLLKMCDDVVGRSINVSFNPVNSLCKIEVANCSGYSCDTIEKEFAGAMTEYNGGVAQDSTASIDNPITIAASSPQAFIGKIINAVMGIVGSLALLMFILGGLIWMTSGGSAEKVKKGRDIVIWSVLGLVVVFASYGLVYFLIKNVQ